METRFLRLLLAAFLLSPLLYAQDGKIRGRVADIENGEALVGANVVVEGTTLGAATDINGDYVVLSVPAGTYTLIARYVGYATFTISNVRVSAGLTHTQDFQLTSSAVQLAGIQVIAERPLIQRNTTNTVRLTTQEDIKELPIRGVNTVNSLIALEAGVVAQAGNLYVRGGRSGEIAFVVDGTPVTNLLYNNVSNVNVIQEAVEEIQLQTGGFTAEYGGSNSAVVRTSIRTGGPKLTGSLTVESDDFAKPGKEFLGTTSRGWRNVVVTAAGPVPGLDNVRFFAAYQDLFQRNATVLWLTPVSVNPLTDDVSLNGAGNPLPTAISIGANSSGAKDWQKNRQVQGTLIFDFNPVKVNLTGSYEYINNPVGGGWPTILQNYFRQNRLYMNDNNRTFVSGRVTHLLDPNTFYEVSGSFQYRKNKQYDPLFGDNWWSYTDSIANAALGYTGWADRWSGPPRNSNNGYYSIFGGYNYLRHENDPNRGYFLDNQSTWGVSLDLTRQMTKNIELKLGGRYDSWVMRQFNISSINGRQILLYGTHGEQVRSFASPEEYRVRVGRAGNISNYGYDVDGNKVDSGVDAPYEPRFLSAYVQSKLEFSDIIINAGLRYEYFKPNAKTFIDPTNPLLNFDQSLDVIDVSQMVAMPTYQFVLPRISFSFPMTASTVFYAQFGKYAQMPSLNQMYTGVVFLSRTVSPSTRGNAYLTPVGYLMAPERTTQYEMGFRQMLGDNFAFTLSGFVKDTRDQLQLRNVVNEQGVAMYRGYLNEDFGTVKGIELTLELKRTQRFSARMNYTLSYATGTGSTPTSAQGQAEQGIGRQINHVNPLSFAQRHKGTVLLDYRWAGDEGGPILSGLGGNILFNFNSGHPYTKIKAISSLGQSDAWTIGVEPQNDPRFSFPIEPINSSTTPFFLNIDASISKLFAVGPLNMELYVAVTNLLNSKQILDVYPGTGEAEDDGWLTNTLSGAFTGIPGYADFYRMINLENRWAYLNQLGTGTVAVPTAPRGGFLTGDDIYGSPRQIRLGVRIEI